MKHLKSYNESNLGSGNTSFNWLDKQNNEAYFQLVDILQSKVFDDFDIVSGTNEDFEDNNNYPDHKFWLYQCNGKLVAPKDLNGGVISSIFVYNIKKDERPSLFDALKGLESVVEDITGKELLIGDEVYPHDLYGDVYDFIIKLG